MKKIISLLLLLMLMLTLSACNGDVVTIEDYEWKMGAVMRNEIEIAQNEDQEYRYQLASSSYLYRRQELPRLW